MDIGQLPQRESGGRLSGKTALVIGAGSAAPGWSNGNAVAALFAREGASIFAVDRSEDALEGTRRMVEELGGSCVVGFADATHGDKLERSVQDCLKAFGRIDILHNNVGRGSVGGVLETAEDDWHSTIDANLTTAFLSCRAVLPIMISQGSGSIINIGSIAGVTYMDNAGIAYSAAKAALQHFTRYVAMQYVRNGIRSNCIMPGHIDTAIIRQRIVQTQGADRLEETLAARASVVPSRRQGTVWDVANAAVYLASDESRFVTGTSIILDGGASVPQVEAYLGKIKR
jgi:NAD(P)-dependent dehydrogenase (short-subunit alcohol dehydrogenase family)